MVLPDIDSIPGNNSFVYLLATANYKIYIIVYFNEFYSEIRFKKLKANWIKKVQKGNEKVIIYFVRFFCDISIVVEKY